MLPGQPLKIQDTLCAHTPCALLLLQVEKKLAALAIIVSFVDARDCRKSCNGWLFACQNVGGSSSPNYERINLARNMNTVTDITNAYQY